MTRFDGISVNMYGMYVIVIAEDGLLVAAINVKTALY